MSEVGASRDLFTSVHLFSLKGNVFTFISAPPSRSLLRLLRRAPLKTCSAGALVKVHERHRTASSAIFFFFKTMTPGRRENAAAQFSRRGENFFTAVVSKRRGARLAETKTRQLLHRSAGLCEHHPYAAVHAWVRRQQIEEVFVNWKNTSK